MDNSSRERRVHLRVYRNFILTYHQKEGDTPKYSVSQVNNVSKGGLSFSSTYSLKPATVLVIDLKTPFVADSIHLEGVVLESKEKIADLIYEVRVQFQKIPDQALSILEKIETYAKAEETKQI